MPYRIGTPTSLSIVNVADVSLCSKLASCFMFSKYPTNTNLQNHCNLSIILLQIGYDLTQRNTAKTEYIDDIRNLLAWHKVYMNYYTLKSYHVI